MTPIHFHQANTIYSVTQPEYRPLHTYRTDDGVVTSCWRMTWRERLRILLTGRIFVSQMTFNQPLQPQMVDAAFVPYGEEVDDDE